jgi:hypothetical protein
MEIKIENMLSFTLTKSKNYCKYCKQEFYDLDKHLLQEMKCSIDYMMEQNTEETKEMSKSNDVSLFNYSICTTRRKGDHTSKCMIG